VPFLSECLVLQPSSISHNKQMLAHPESVKRHTETLACNSSCKHNWERYNYDHSSLKKADISTTNK